MTQLQMTRRTLLGAVGVFALAAAAGPAAAADAKLKIGFVGVTLALSTVDINAPVKSE